LSNVYPKQLVDPNNFPNFLVPKDTQSIQNVTPSTVTTARLW